MTALTRSHFALLAAALAGILVPASGVSPQVPRFEEITAEAGVHFVHRNGAQGRKYLVETMGSGGGFTDLDNDGLPDLYLVQSGAHFGRGEGANRLFLNLGKGHFRLLSGSGAEDRGYGMGVTFGDYDNDGQTDIYVTNFGPNVLLRNLGGGRFQDVSKEAGVADPAWSTSAAFADVNQDGYLDLYVGNYLKFTYATHVECGDRDHPSYCHPDVYPAAANTFYLNQGDGTFREATRSSGLLPENPEASKTLGVLFFDMDQDGDLDLYVANDSTPNFLFENRGRGSFRDVSLLSGAAYNADGETEAGMGVDARDLNLDGLPDLIVTHLDFETNTLYLNQGHGFFLDATEEAGLGGPSRTRVGFGANLADFNNDGYPDLFVANGHVIDTIERENPSIQYAQPNQLFLNLGEGRFEDQTSGVGPAFRRALVSRGSATADWDNDGDLDLVILNNHGPARLLANQGSTGHWIQFLLRGRHCNRNAIGASLLVVSGDYRYRQEVRSASSYCSQNDFRLHFGLGARDSVEEVLIRWPCGRIQRMVAPAINRIHLVEELEK